MRTLCGLAEHLDSVAFDHRVGEHIVSDLLDLALGGVTIRRVDVDFEYFSLTDGGDGSMSETRERGLDGLSLWVEHGRLQRNENARFHREKP